MRWNPTENKMRDIVLTIKSTYEKLGRIGEKKKLTERPI